MTSQRNLGQHSVDQKDLRNLTQRRQDAEPQKTVREAPYLFFAAQRPSVFALERNMHGYPAPVIKSICALERFIFLAVVDSHGTADFDKSGVGGGVGNFGAFE